MNTINSLDEILKLAESGNLYVRWSRGPEMDKAQGQSRDYVSGGRHNGLSCVRVNPENNRTMTAMQLVEYRFLRRKDADIFGWLFCATANGKDSDNAPTVDASTIAPVARLSDDLIERLSAFSDAYWAHHNMPKVAVKEMGGQIVWLNSYPRLADYLSAEVA